jgi:tetratricopeptide (TPR) repeat protein
VGCHRRAIDALSELALGDDASRLADLGAAWVNLGCALQAGAGREEQMRSLGAFDRAIGILERLPVRSDPRFRHNLAAAWMNRADALARIDTAGSRSEALPAYGCAVAIASELPLDEKASFRILLASCWINLGSLRQRLSDLSGAALAYDRAVAALGNLPRAGHRMACHHAATALTNRGEALLEDGSRDGAARAVSSAKLALSQFEGRDVGGPARAKLSLRALRVMARGLEALLRFDRSRSVDRVAALTDLAERGLDLALAFRNRAPEIFDPFFIWFYSFGSRVYGRYQPQFLREFLEEGLGRWDFRGSAGVGADLRAIARQATAGALEELGCNRVLVEGARPTELLLDTVQVLRGAAAVFA